MTIYKNINTGTMTPGFAGMDHSDYEIMSSEEVLDEIDKAPTWDCIDTSVYKALCSSTGVDYDAYDTPGDLYDAVAAALGRGAGKM